jgi:thiamine phosphate synthase YjbQ (UPF0047 family)
MIFTQFAELLAVLPKVFDASHGVRQLSENWVKLADAWFDLGTDSGLVAVPSGAEEGIIESRILQGRLEGLAYGSASDEVEVGEEEEDVDEDFERYIRKLVMWHDVLIHSRT